MEPRKHTVGGGPDPQTRKNIIVIEDPELAPDRVRVECAFSDMDFGQVVALAYPNCQVVPKKGHPRHTMHIFIHPRYFDDMVRDFEDPKVTPFSEEEIRQEVRRGFRQRQTSKRRN